MLVNGIGNRTLIIILFLNLAEIKVDCLRREAIDWLQLCSRQEILLN